MSNAVLLGRLWMTRQRICHWCDTPLVLMPRWPGGITPPGTVERKNTASVDHIVPRVWDGRNTEENAVLSCLHCNQMRAAAGHCMAALDCALDVLGPGAKLGDVARFYRQFRIEEEARAIARRKERRETFRPVWTDPASPSALAVALAGLALAD